MALLHSKNETKICQMNNREYCAKYATLRVPEMALPVPEMKIRDHFYRPNTPPKPGKNHIRNAFLPLESGFLAILFI